MTLITRAEPCSVAGVCPCVVTVGAGVGCVKGANVEIGCVIRGLGRANANLPVIMRRLRRAAAPGTPMAAMTLYDPFLQLYLLPGEQQEALTIDSYARNINSLLALMLKDGALTLDWDDEVLAGACVTREKT